MISNLFKGFGHIMTGLSLLNQPGIRRFVIAPLSINFVLFGGAIYYLFSKFDGWIASITPNFPEWLSWLDWLETLINWILWPLFSLMLFLIVFYTFSLIANLGFVPPGVPFDALEISRHITPAEARRTYPQLQNYPLIQNGDVHYLHEFMGVNIFYIKRPTISELKLALQNQEGRSLNLRSAG